MRDNEKEQEEVAIEEDKEIRGREWVRIHRRIEQKLERN